MLQKLFHLLLIGLMTLSASSCTTVNDYTEDLISYIPGMNYFVPSNVATIKIESSRCVNNGAPLHVMIKAIDFPTFISDDYDKIVQSVIHHPEGACSFHLCTVLPGQDRLVQIDTTDVTSLGVYCLFTNPGDNWKSFLKLEDPCPTITLILENNEIVSVQN